MQKFEKIGVIKFRRCRGRDLLRLANSSDYRKVRTANRQRVSIPQC